MMQAHRGQLVDVTGWRCNRRDSPLGCSTPQSGHLLLAPAGQLPANARERAKRVTYGIIYGLTPFGLSQQLRDQGVTVAAAELLIDSFLAAFPAVKRFMDSSVAAATQCGWVTTLLGRRRQIGGLQSKDGRERAAAARKVVNTIIQVGGSSLSVQGMGCRTATYTQVPLRRPVCMLSHRINLPGLRCRQALAGLHAGVNHSTLRVSSGIHMLLLCAGQCR